MPDPKDFVQYARRSLDRISDRMRLMNMEHSVYYVQMRTIASWLRHVEQCDDCSIVYFKPRSDQQWPSAVDVHVVEASLTDESSYGLDTVLEERSPATGPPSTP